MDRQAMRVVQEVVENVRRLLREHPASSDKEEQQKIEEAAAQKLDRAITKIMKDYQLKRQKQIHKQG